MQRALDTWPEHSSEEKLEIVGGCGAVKAISAEGRSSESIFRGNTRFLCI